ncbi:MAG TPA: hypothetical protein VF796_24025 [Humisphaera sp.]
MSGDDERPPVLDYGRRRRRRKPTGVRGLLDFAASAALWILAFFAAATILAVLL